MTSISLEGIPTEEGMVASQNHILVPEDVTPGYSGDLTSTGYTPPADMSFDQFSYEVGTTIGWAKIVNWVIGDLLRFGEDKWPDRYSQAILLTGKSEQHLYNVVWVSKVWRPHERHPDMSWSHHLELSGIRNDEERVYWINKAADEQWTREELRNARKELKEHEELDKKEVVIPDDVHRNLRAAIADFMAVLSIQRPSKDQEMSLDAEWGTVEVRLKLSGSQPV